MTESEWLTRDEPQLMLEFLKGRASDRKLRLFALACCRRIWHLLTPECGRAAVEAAERFADGTADEAQLAAGKWRDRFPLGTWDDAAVLTAVPRYDRPSVLLRYGIVDWAPVEQTQRRLEHLCTSGSRFPADVALAVARKAGAAGSPEEAAAQAALLRCLFGPRPCQPPVADPAWLVWNNGTVGRIAQAIYEERRFEELPVLADGLEDVGCGHEAMLAHCRGPRPHARGCWAVDLLLGKE